MKLDTIRFHEQMIREIMLTLTAFFFSFSSAHFAISPFLYSSFVPKDKRPPVINGVNTDLSFIRIHLLTHFSLSEFTLSFLSFRLDFFSFFHLPFQQMLEFSAFHHSVFSISLNANIAVVYSKSFSSHSFAHSSEKNSATFSRTKGWEFAKPLLVGTD